MANVYPEDVARKLLALYENDYATYLAEVEASRAATEDITLNDFVQRRVSANLETPDQFSGMLPGLVIGEGELLPVPELELQRGQTAYDIVQWMVYWLKGLDQTKLAYIVMRHIEATRLLFKNNPRLGYNAMARVRDIEFIPGNVMPQGNSYVKGLRVTFRLRVLGYGI